MDFLRADVSGPVFLGLYAAFAIVVIVAVRRISGSDPRDEAPDAGFLDADADPFAIAYLRGGRHELLRFTIFELVREHALRVATVGKSKTENGVEATGLAAPAAAPETLASEILAFCAQPRTTPAILGSTLPMLAEEVGEERYAPGLRARRFLQQSEALARSRTALAIGAGLLLALAGARFVEAALLHHRNVAFLIIELVVAETLLFALGRPARLTPRGRAYLAKLKLALAPAAALAPNPLGPAAAGAVALPLLVAATGFEGLAGTPYASMRTIFPRSSDSCGGGCGSSGGDGGGGDGGGGGCGGGCGG
jgi:uncharacterized protein (TIGR04222 family)